MNSYRIDVMTWYTERKLNFKPKHFVDSKTSISRESELWIYNTLSGRFCLFTNQDNWQSMFDPILYPSFEDPKELVLYELKWS